MILQNWWYTSLLGSKTKFYPPLQKNIQCDILVIGGGMAGMHAALRACNSGKKVVLLERNICGGSSTGKSAGFLTPDSELELNDLFRRFGMKAKDVWGIAAEGVQMIMNNIKKYNIQCDSRKQDSVYVGIGKDGYESVKEEVKARNHCEFTSRFYDTEEVSEINTGKGYRAAVRYGGTFGINPLQYSQQLKNVLVRKGVQVFESTMVIRIKKHTAKTHLGSVTAKKIIVCVDKMKRELSSMARHAYHAQTFLSISEPLGKKDIKLTFPGTEIMCWDSKLVYSYYRLTGDRRLLVGGGSMMTTFTPMDVTSPRVINSVISEFKKRFPHLKHVQFVQYWPGRIDTTKDLLPIVDSLRGEKHIKYVIGCVGLPWATYCGDYAVRKAMDDAVQDKDEFLTANRKFFIPPSVQRILGKIPTFILNNGYSKYIQKGY